MSVRRIAALALIPVLLVAIASREATTGNLAILAVAEDAFYNYDFLSQSASPGNVDWPVCLIFYGNAYVDKVKNIYWGVTIFAYPMYAYLNDGSGWVWDTDRGTKGIVYSTYLNAYVYLHMRVYAPNPPDYMSNSYWGRYVLATAHYDQFPLESWSGYTEYAERDLASIASSKGYAVFVDWAYFYNPEPYRAEGNHIWLNDGYATAVYVP